MQGRQQEEWLMLGDQERLGQGNLADLYVSFVFNLLVINVMIVKIALR